jgi:hypothetical protein
VLTCAAGAAALAVLALVDRAPYAITWILLTVVLSGGGLGGLAAPADTVWAQEAG